jgi:prepilin-type N-terminal cleavage/methylation domain-containing protein
MRQRAGFTIVELLITLTIMVILITLATVNLANSMASARDVERKTDVENIMVYQENQYVRNGGWYFPVSAAGAGALSWYENFDKNNLRAPGIVDPAISLVGATNATQTTTGVAPAPTEDTYVYQPLTSAGLRCTNAGPPNECRKYNIFYVRESDGVIVKLSSKNQ